MRPAPLRLGRRPLLLGGAAAAGLARSGHAQGTGRAIESVATFSNPHQVTGVAVAPSGRVFVNFPRWEEDVAISVAEVGSDGTVAPYPDAAWNSYRDASPANPGNRFVCVQSVTVDPLGYLWVVDPAAPNLSFEVTGGPKLVRIDPRSNQVMRVYRLDERVAPQGTYLNDIRFTPDGQRAVLTNSGQPGSLITLDVGSGAVRRVLDGHPSTQFQQGVQVVVGGKPLRRPDGQPPQFSADGLAIDLRGEYVYWQATTGTTMYRAPIPALFETRADPASLGGAIQIVARTFIADGYWMSKRGALYLTSCSDNAVKQLLPDGQFATVVQDSRLLWPDSMAEGPDGAIYVTASHIPQMLAWQGPGVAQTQLFRFRPG
jgi:sugar lactone lactonase YvrE